MHRDRLGLWLILASSILGLDAVATPHYLVVTSTNLSAAFAPLIDYRRNSGFAVDIITLDRIEQDYPGRDVQERLRACTATYFASNGPSFVLSHIPHIARPISVQCNSLTDRQLAWFRGMIVRAVSRLQRRRRAKICRWFLMARTICSAC
jgi:hypothetical protein